MHFSSRRGSQKDEVHESCLRPRRHAHTTRNCADRERWGLSVHKLMSMPYLALLSLLRQHKILPQWKGKKCPHCATGTLDKLTNYKGMKGWAYRSRAKGCQRYVRQNDFHPIFQQGCGRSSTSLPMQASIYSFALLLGFLNTICQRIWMCRRRLLLLPPFMATTIQPELASSEKDSVRWREGLSQHRGG